MFEFIKPKNVVSDADNEQNLAINIYCSSFLGSGRFPFTNQLRVTVRSAIVLFNLKNFEKLHTIIKETIVYSGSVGELSKQGYGRFNSVPTYYATLLEDPYPFTKLTLNVEPQFLKINAYEEFSA